MFTSSSLRLTLRPHAIISFYRIEIRWGRMIVLLGKESYEIVSQNQIASSTPKTAN